MTELFDSRCFFHMQRVQKREKEGTNFDLENVEKSAKTFITICLVQDTPKREIGSRFAIRFWQLLYRENN